jgi:hypothetical protein
MTRIQGVWRRCVAGGTTAIALACGDSDLPTVNTGGLQVAVSPASLSVPQGGSGSLTVSLTRGGDYAGDVTLSVSGLPAGVTTTINPAQLTGSTTSATIDVAVAATVALGNYTATITAAGQDVAQATTNYELIVTAAPNYTLTLTPTSLTVAAGASGNAVVNISRTNFTGGVTLSLQNPPAGITATFNPSPSTTNASDLVLSVAASVAAGNYALTVQGSATGITARTVALQLTVLPPPTGGNNVEYQFCDATAVPAFFAFQDGNNAWQAVTPVTSGSVTKFAFNITQGRGGVLIVSQTAAAAVADVLRAGRSVKVRQHAAMRASLRGIRRRGTGVQSLTSTSLRSFADVYETTVIYATTAELAQDGIANCSQTTPTKTITGTVTGVPAGSYGIVSFGNTVEIFNGATSSNPVTFDVPPGPRDLVGSLTIPGSAPSRLILMRNLNIPDAGSLPSAIDYNGQSSLTPATANVTITGGSGDSLEVFVDLVTANTEAGIWFDLSPTPNATRPWAGLRASDMQSSDLHALIVFASEALNDDFRVASKYVGPVANQTIAIGPALTSAAATQVAAGAYPRFRFQGTHPTEYSKGVSVDVGFNTSGNTYSIMATGAYISGGGAYNFTMPDVSGLAGFPIASRLTAGPNDVVAGAWGFTDQGVFDPRPTLGGEFKAAQKTTSVTVP